MEHTKRYTAMHEGTYVDYNRGTLRGVRDKIRSTQPSLTIETPASTEGATTKAGLTSDGTCMGVIYPVLPVASVV